MSQFMCLRHSTALGQIDFERLYLKKSLGCQQSWQTKIARAEDQGNHHSVLGRQQP